MSVALWRAVILQALSDAQSESRSCRYRIKEKREALQYILTDNKHFFQVCELADMCPSYVRRKLRSMLERAEQVALPKGIEEDKIYECAISVLKRESTASNSMGFDEFGIIENLPKEILLQDGRELERARGTSPSRLRDILS